MKNAVQFLKQRDLIPEKATKRKDDATDALGIALCYVLNKKLS